jgi:molybdenum cofactor cytidylyltransferase
MVALVVLAAGAGTRFRAAGGRGHKLLAPYGDGTVVEAAVGHAVESGAGPVYVVVGATDLSLDADLRAAVHLVDNPSWQDGMAASLRAAVGAVAGDGHDALVVGLGDQPGIDPEAWRRVAAAGSAIAFARYGGRRGHPVRLAAEVWPLLPRSGETGARRMAQAHPDLVGEVPCPGSPRDVDIPADLRGEGWA